MSSSLHERIRGISRRVPGTITNLEWLDDVLEEELLVRLKLVYAQTLDEESYGIVSSDDPVEHDGTDSTDPLVVMVNEDNDLAVDVYPGLAVCSAGLWMEISSVVSGVALAATGVGSQNVVYLEYQNVETTMVPARSRTTGINSRRDVEDATDLVQVATLADFQALDSATLRRVVPLALVTVQSTSSTTTTTVVDLTAATLTGNRPWFSPVDIYHRAQQGTGTVTASNPHGMTANDFQAAGDLSLYDLLVGQGAVVSPPASYAGVPGTSCVETIPRTRWLQDSLGEVTETVGAFYVELLGYPTALGACELQDSSLGTQNNQLLPVLQVPRTNIVYVTPEHMRTVVVPQPASGTPSSTGITVTLVQCGLGDNRVVVAFQAGSGEAASWDATSKTLTVTFVASTSTTLTLAATMSAVTATLPAVFVSLTATGSDVWVAGDAAQYSNIADDAEFKLYYTCAQALEPPADYSSEPSLTFSAPQGDEAYITNGLAYDTIIDPELSLENLGPIPRRVWVVYDEDDGFKHIPQVLLPYSRLEDATDDTYEIAQTFYGPGKVRIWLTGAVASSSLNVELTLTGTDADGNSQTEVVTFDSTWIDNPATATTEQPYQMQSTAATFGGSALTIEITDRTADGPFSAIVVEVVPEFVYEETSGDRVLLVAAIHWDGFRASSLTDWRTVVPSLKKLGRPRWEQAGEATLAHFSIFPDNEWPLTLLLGDDIDDMRNSDQILTRHFAPSGERKLLADPALSSSDPEGLDSYYYSRAIRPPADTQFFQVVLFGKARHVDSGSTSRVQIRYTTDAAPDTWSSWAALTQNAYITRGRDQTSMAFCIFLPDESGFTATDAAHQFQLRIVGEWSSFATYVSSEDLREISTGDAALLAAFATEHYAPGSGSYTGNHKSIIIVPEQAASTKARIYVYAHANDNAVAVSDKVIRVFGYTDTLATSPSEILYLTVGGTLGVVGGLTVAGDASVSGDLTVGDDITADGYFYDSTTGVIVEIPLSAYASILDNSAPAPTTWSSALVSIQDQIAGVSLSTDQRPYVYGNGSGWFIAVDLDPYLRSGCDLYQVELIAEFPGGVTPANITVELWAILAVGSGTAWTNVATDTQTCPAGASTRRQLVFTLNQSVISSNLYMLMIKHASGYTELAIHRTRIVYRDTSISTLIGGA